MSLNVIVDKEKEKARKFNYHDFCYLGNHDIFKIGVIIIQGNQFHKQSDYDDLVNYISELTEETIKISERNYGKPNFIICADLKKTTLKNVDMKFIKKIIPTLQDKYPDRLEKCIIRNIPIFFKMVYSIICPLIDKVTRKKIYFEKKNENKNYLSNEL